MIDAILRILTLGNLVQSSRNRRIDVTAPGRELAHAFHQVGNLVGKTELEIVEIVGNPTSIHNGNGYRLLQWQATGYHAALQFTPEGMFVKIQSEYCNL